MVRSTVPVNMVTLRTPSASVAPASHRVRPHFGYLTEVVDSEPVLWRVAAELICWIPRMPMSGRSIMTARSTKCTRPE